MIIEPGKLYKTKTKIYCRTADESIFFNTISPGNIIYCTDTKFTKARDIKIVFLFKTGLRLSWFSPRYTGEIDEIGLTYLFEELVI